MGEGPHPPNRHSRVSGNPGNPDSSMPPFGIAVLDSRLRGKDGRKGGRGGYRRGPFTFLTQVAVQGRD